MLEAQLHYHNFVGCLICFSVILHPNINYCIFRRITDTFDTRNFIKIYRSELYSWYKIEKLRKGEHKIDISTLANICSHFTFARSFSVFLASYHNFENSLLYLYAMHHMSFLSIEEMCVMVKMPKDRKIS